MYVPDLGRWGVVDPLAEAAFYRADFRSTTPFEDALELAKSLTK